MKRLYFVLILIILTATFGGYWYLSKLKAESYQSMDWVYSYEVKMGTVGMVELLDTINYWQEERIKLLNELVWYKRIGHIFYKPITTKIHEARDLLHNGETNKTIEILEGLSSEVEDSKERVQFQYQELLAIAYLRLGEQENCIINHSNNSCIMPIQGDGIYTLQENTRKAIAVYEKLLALRPNDWRYRWLLNVAFQTIGEYPDSISEQWLIESDLMQDKNPSDNFKNIAPQLGVDFESNAGGAILEDFNNDGLLDILVSGMYDDQLKYYENDGSAGYIDRTKFAGLEGLINGFNLYPLDYNNDGWKDVLIIRGAWRRNLGKYPNSLLKNNGDGTFSDVSLESGFLSFNPSSSAVCADFNQDGWTDIYVGNESNPTIGFDYPNELYINDGNGNFEEVGTQSGVDVICLSKGVVAGDYNNDGLTDIFVSNRGGKNYLLRNKGNNEVGIPEFEEVSKLAGVDKPLTSFTAWFWDYNNDGYLDLFVSAYEYGRGSSAASAAKYFAGINDSTSRPFLYCNNADGTFTNRSSELDLDFPLSTMGANFGDVNNDGWLDFYIGTGEPDYMGIHPNRLLINKEGKGFEDKTFELGVGHIQKGHGISFGDIDRDGDQDILAEMGGSANGDKFQNALFQNPGQPEHYWVNLRLVGQQSSKDAIGAKIKLVVSKENSSQMFFRTVSSGGSFGSNSLLQEIGLGQNDKIDSLVVRWPNTDTLQYFLNVPINKHYLIEEAEGITDLNYEAIEFEMKEHKHMHH